MALDQIERLKNDTNVGQPPLHRTAKLGSENEGFG